MEITNELLAAYAENNVTPEERKQIREYLVDHPSQLESVMLMMDEDYEMEAKSEKSSISSTGMKPPRMKNVSFAGAAYFPSTKANYGMKENAGDDFPNIKNRFHKSTYYFQNYSEKPASPTTGNSGFDKILGDLLDELI